VEGNSLTFSKYFRILLERLRKSTENFRIVGILAEIPNEHFPNGKQKGWNLPEFAVVLLLLSTHE
jgi:hypothetical protein